MAVEIADQLIVRNGFFVDAESAVIRVMSEEEPEKAAEEEVGWWSYSSSVTQQKLEGIYSPSMWCPMPS